MADRSSMPRIRTIDAHVAGQAVRLIVDGVPVPAGPDVASRLDRAERDPDFERLRQQVLWEPRGHADLLGALLTDAAEPEAHAGVLFIDGDRYFALSGTGLMAVATIALERGLLLTGRADGEVRFETGEGLVHVRVARAGDGRAGSVTLEAPPSVVLAGGAMVRWGQRTVRVDLVSCAGLHAIVDAEGAGIGLSPLDRRQVTSLAGAVSRHVVAGRVAPPLVQILLTGPAGDEADLRIVPVSPAGRIGRSPSGLGTAAVVTVLDAMGFVHDDRAIVVEGPAGEPFEARVTARHTEAELTIVRVAVTGAAWITGEHTLLVDDRDPLGDGFVVG
jgi:proline racemase